MAEKMITGQKPGFLQGVSMKTVGWAEMSLWLRTGTF